jgi:hypothetical protein
VVADAVGVKLVSAAEFPANREKNRDFFDSGAIPENDAGFNPMIAVA